MKFSASGGVRRGLAAGRARGLLRHRWPASLLILVEANRPGSSSTSNGSASRADPGADRPGAGDAGTPRPRCRRSGGPRRRRPALAGAGTRRGRPVDCGPASRRADRAAVAPNHAEASRRHLTAGRRPASAALAAPSPSRAPSLAPWPGCGWRRRAGGPSDGGLLPVGVLPSSRGLQKLSVAVEQLAHVIDSRSIGSSGRPRLRATSMSGRCCSGRSAGPSASATAHYRADGAIRERGR
jgi:hypothetical protein